MNIIILVIIGFATVCTIGATCISDKKLCKW
jgi:hypothetical protein